MIWWAKRVHLVWLITAMCYGVVGGVVLAQWWSGAAWWLALIAATPLVILAFWRRRRVALILTLVVGVMLGLVRGSGDQTLLALYQPLQNQIVRITGVVQDDADVVANGLRLQLGDIRMKQTSLPGKVWLSLRTKAAIQRGDVVTLRGILRPGFGNYAAVLGDATLERIERTAGGDPALDLRDHFADGVRRAIDEPAASLGVGFLLGKKSMLPEDLLEALKIAGLTHIIVASGYNLTILVRLARRLFGRVSKFTATFVSGGLVVVFVAMTGASPSMTRAGLVTGLSLLAWYYGRKFHPVVLLGLVAAVTVLWNPSFAWGDMGWMLSFAAFAGVIIVAPIMTAYFFAKEQVPAITQILLETLAAQLVTAPLIMMTFGTFSVIALLANLLVGPLIPLAMLLTAVSGLGGLLLPGFADVIGWPAEMLLNIIVGVVNWCADQPWAQADWQLPWWGVVLWYAALVVIICYMKRRSGYRLHDSNVVV